MIVGKQFGFTLTEVMVSLALAGIILGSVFTAFHSQQTTYKTQDQVSEMQQNIRTGLNMMVQEIMQAGYDPSGGGNAGVSAATSTGITVTMVADNDSNDNDNDGTVDEINELNTIQYDIYDAYGDGDNDIGRQVGASAATKRAVVENVEAIEYLYTLEDNTNTLNPSASQREKIRAIEISLLVRTSYIIKNASSAVYLSGSGTSWGPYPDNYRRLLLRTTIQCRNMGL